jgi:hypothetical protein
MPVWSPTQDGLSTPAGRGEPSWSAPATPSPPQAEGMVAQALLGAGAGPHGRRLGSIEQKVKGEETRAMLGARVVALAAVELVEG